MCIRCPPVWRFPVSCPLFTSLKVSLLVSYSIQPLYILCCPCPHISFLSHMLVRVHTYLHTHHPPFVSECSSVLVSDLPFFFLTSPSSFWLSFVCTTDCFSIPPSLTFADPIGLTTPSTSLSCFSSLRFLCVLDLYSVFKGFSSFQFPQSPRTYRSNTNLQRSLFQSSHWLFRVW